MWLAEALWEARLSPWRRLARRAGEDERRRALETAAELMRASRRRAAARPRTQVLPPRRAAVPALRHADPVVGAGRRQPHRVLVPACQVGDEPARRVLTYVGSRRTPLRAPHLYESLRGFCLGGVRGRARRGGAVRVRGARDARQARRSTSTARSSAASSRSRRRRCAGCPTRATRSTTCGASRRRRSSRARTPGSADTSDDALFRSILLPLLTWTAERCGGFDWHDEAFDAAYAELEQSLFGTARTYVALAPLVGLSAGADGRPRRRHPRARRRSPARSRQLWPEARGLMPPEFGRDVDRLLRARARARARRRTRPSRRTRPPSWPTRSRALRLATAGRDRGRPGRLRAARLPAAADRAAAADRGDAAARRGDRGSTRSAARLAADLRERLPLADDDRELGEALDRWELSLFAEEPFRSAQLREALTCAARRRRRRVGRGAARGRAARREDGRARRAARGAARRARCGGDARDAVRRALVETLAARRPRRLVAALDETLLGLRPRPATVLARRAESRLVAALRRRRHAFGTRVGTDTSHLRSATVGAMDESGRRVLASGCERIERARADRGARRERAPASGCSTSCGRSSARPRRGRGPRATRARASAVDETSRGGGRNELDANRNGAVHGSRPPPSASQRSRLPSVPGPCATRR